MLYKIHSGQRVHVCIEKQLKIRANVSKNLVALKTLSGFAENMHTALGTMRAQKPLTFISKR